MNRVRLALPGDVSALTTVYTQALPDDLLPRLGRWYLEKVFFPVTLECPGAFTLVHELDARAQAFIVMARDAQELTDRLASRRAALLFALMRGIFGDPGLAGTMFDLVVRTRVEEGIAPSEALPELYVIAVAPTLQGQGAGTGLVREAMARLATDGGGFSGCLVKTSSANARRFYERCGFKAAGRELRGSRVLDILVMPPGDPSRQDRTD